MQGFPRPAEFFLAKLLSAAGFQLGAAAQSCREHNGYAEPRHPCSGRMPVAPPVLPFNPATGRRPVGRPAVLCGGGPLPTQHMAGTCPNPPVSPWIPRTFAVGWQPCPPRPALPRCCMWPLDSTQLSITKANTNIQVARATCHCRVAVARWVRDMRSVAVGVPPS